jgi:hypothetical protein
MALQVANSRVTEIVAKCCKDNVFLISQRLKNCRRDFSQSTTSR